MIDKTQDTEQLAEVLMAAYAKELCRSQDAYLDGLEDDLSDDPPLFAPAPEIPQPQPPTLEMALSEKTLPEIPLPRPEQMTPAPSEAGAGDRRRRGGRGRTVKRVFALVAVLVLIQGMIAVSEGSKENTFNFFQEERDGRTVLTYLGLGSGGELPAFALGYVPDGYRLIDETVTDTAKEISYVNDADEYLYFTVQRNEDYNASLDDEGMEKETVSIKGYSGYLFHGGGECVLMWQIGEYTLDLSGQMPPGEAVKLAEGVVLKKER